MNVTLSLDEQVVLRAREVARSMGKSLNQVIREHLERLAGLDQVEADIRELRRLTAEGQGDSRGWRFNREELYGRS